MSEPARISFACPGSKLLRRLAGRVAHQKVAGQFGWCRLLVLLRFVGDERNAGLGVLQPVGPGLADERDDVVHAGAVGGPRFGELHPFVGLEGRRDQDVLILDDAGGRDLIRRRQFDHGVRFRNRPAIGKLRAAAACPSDSLAARRHPPRLTRVSISFCWSDAVVGELAVMRIGEPRRHLPLQHRLFDRLGPRTGLLIGEQRKRRRLARTMATLAAGLQNRRDILREMSAPSPPVPST